MARMLTMSFQFYVTLLQPMWLWCGFRHKDHTVILRKKSCFVLKKPVYVATNTTGDAQSQTPMYCIGKNCNLHKEKGHLGLPTHKSKENRRQADSLYCLFLELTYLSCAYIFNRNTSEAALWPKQRTPASPYFQAVYFNGLPWATKKKESERRN